MRTLTRSSLVWVVTGVAAGIVGGWLWNRGEPTPRPAPETTSAAHSELARSPFAPRSPARTVHSSNDVAARGVQVEGARTRGVRASESEFAKRDALYAQAASADREQLDSMIGEAMARPNEADRRDALEILLLRYAELDHDGAFQHAIQTDHATAVHLVGALAASNPERAWQQASTVGDLAQRRAYLGAALTTWVAQEPDRAFAKLQALPADWQRDELLKQFADEMAHRDPQRAVALLASIDSPATSSLLGAVAAQWSRDDPSAAAKWVESMPPAQVGQLAYQIADAYVAQKPDEALAWALRISRSSERMLWSYMVGQIAAYDPYRALELAQASQNPSQRARALGNVLKTIAQRNPALAMSHLMKLPDGEMRVNVIREIAGGMASKSAGAIDWVNGIDDRALRRAATESLAWSMTRLNVENAAQLIDRVPKESRSTWITAVAVSYADVDPEKGRQWVRKYSSDAPFAAMQFARVIAARSPETALQMAEGIADPQERDQLIAGMLPQIAQQSPETAARWAESVSDSKSKSRAVLEVTNVWQQYDWPAARRWILGLESGTVRDQAVTQLLNGRDASLNESIELIQQIQAPEQRMNAVLSAALRLAQSDVESARTLVRRHPLDPQRQQQFELALQRRSGGKGQ